MLMEILDLMKREVVDLVVKERLLIFMNHLVVLEVMDFTKRELVDLVEMKHLQIIFLQLYLSLFYHFLIYHL